ncbi:MAG TPA: DUF1269 domain-containing protein [Burkholderiaceae bacterium]|nr:DUF1269 domain-containing protein [Burkholderiaceae bacterium]
MRRRIYWILPDVQSGETVMQDLLLARIDAGHIHFMAREEIALGDLPAANALQTSDMVRSAQAGLIGGGLLGGVFGAWTSSMIGASVPSHRLTRFERALAQGRLLLMADVPRGRVAEIEQRLHALHPEASLEGIEPGIPAFP